jgi:L-seryl-tRNA(Ser) seleniumtransferase
MISTPQRQLASRATDWANQLRAQGINAHTQRGESTIGGGSLPGEILPTTLLALHATDFTLSLAEIAQRLRHWSTPIVPRISRDTLLLNPRTVLPEQDSTLLHALTTITR